MGYDFELFSEFPAHSSIEFSEVKKYYEFVELLDTYNFTGTLVYYYHLTLDPWMIATSIVQNTTKHVPLMALQPYTTPPATAAKLIHSFVRLYNRKIYVNMVSGQDPKDLMEVSNTLEKEERYKRLTEYTTILRALLSSNEPFTYEGDYYSYNNLRINSMVMPEFFPKFYIANGSSLSSSSSTSSAQKVGDVLLMLPESFSRYQDFYRDKIVNTDLSVGFKINIIARGTYEEAIEAAKATEAFTMRQALKRKYKENLEYSAIEDDILFPSTYMPGEAPVLVGSYTQIADYLEGYLKLGVSHFIIGNLHSLELTKGCNEVFQLLRVRG